MYSYRPLDDALARAVLVGAAPEQRAWLGGASGDERQLDGAEAAAAELFCRAQARSAQSAECRQTCADALAFVHGTLSRRRRQAVVAHRETCAECAWTIDLLPGLADAVGTIASVYAEAMIGPPEAPAGALGKPVPTALHRSRRPVIAVAAAAALGLAGVGAAVAQGWRSNDEPLPVVVEEDLPFEDPSSPETAPPSTEPTPDESTEPSDAPSDTPSDTPSDAAATPDTATTPGSGVRRPTSGGATPSAPWQQSVPVQPAGTGPAPGETASGSDPAAGSTTPGSSTPGSSTPGSSTAGGSDGGSDGGSTSADTGGTGSGETDTSGTESQETAPPSGGETEPPGTGTEPGTDPAQEPETPAPDPTTPVPEEPGGEGTVTPEPSPTTTDVSEEP